MDIKNEPIITFKTDGTKELNSSQLTCKVETITPELAAKYLKLNNINRPLNKQTVAFYAKEMTNGEWKLNGEAICFQGDVLVNGQHRLQACIQSNTPFRTAVIRGVEENSLITYDSGKLRTNADVLSLKGIKYSTTVASSIVKYNVLKRDCSSISWRATSDSGRLKLSKDELINIYNQCSVIFDYAAEISTRLSNGICLINRAFLAAMIVYLIF